MTTEGMRPWLRRASPWLLVAVLSVLFAACAQGAGTGTASSSASIDPQDAGLLYAQCMRDSGVPDFPDPNADGSFALGHDQFDRDDPTFQAAIEECRELAPGGEHQNTGDPATVEQMREFSQCMRDNGLPDFPDPDADGRLRGIGHEDEGDPDYQAAFEVCRDKLPGGGDHQ